MISGFDTPNQLTQTIVRSAKFANMQGAGRYISGGGSWKHLSQAEVDLCGEEDFGLWLIDEGTGDAAQFAGDGRAAGEKAATVANELGVPGGTPIFVGVDFAADAADIPAIQRYMLDYQAGCGPYIGGMYADGLIASAVPTKVGDFLPGATGWPGYAAYVASGKAALIQHPQTRMFGIDVDPVEILDLSVLWFPGKSATPAPKPVEPASPPIMLSASLVALQQYLNVTADNIIGPETEAALINYVRHFYGQ